MNKRFIGLLMLCFILWCGGFLAFLYKMPASYEAEEKLDAVVVLTGGSHRLQEGISLIEQGMADRLLISGVGKGVKVEELLNTLDIDNSALLSKTTLGFLATDTKSNAVETLAWSIFHDIDSFYLVTSSYHTVRAHYEFNQLMPEHHIASYPVFSDNVPVDEWWQYPGTIGLLLKEYHKMIWIVFWNWI